MLFDPPSIRLVDEFQAEEDHVFGWVFHALGELAVRDPKIGSELPAGLPPIPTAGRWRCLRDRRYGRGSGSVKALWELADGLRLDLRTVTDMAEPPAPFQVVTARGLGQPFQQPIGTLLYRVSSHQLLLRTVLTIS